jgi:hypothetical protein
VASVGHPHVQKSLYRGQGTVQGLPTAFPSCGPHQLGVGCLPKREVYPGISAVPAVVEFPHGVGSNRGIITSRLNEGDQHGHRMEAR